MAIQHFATLVWHLFSNDDMGSYTPTQRCKRRKTPVGGAATSSATSTATGASAPPPPPCPKSETTGSMRVRVVGMIEATENASEQLRFGLNSDTAHFELSRSSALP